MAHSVNVKNSFVEAVWNLLKNLKINECIWLDLYFANGIKIFFHAQVFIICPLQFWIPITNTHWDISYFNSSFYTLITHHVRASVDATSHILISASMQRLDAYMRLFDVVSLITYFNIVRPMGR